MRFLFRSVWLWPLCILLLTTAADLITLVPDVTALPYMGVARPFVVMGFLFVCPGMAIARFFRLQDALSEFVLGVSLSFVIGAFIAGIILYAHIWSPTLIFDILLGFSVAGALAQLLLAFSRWFLARSGRRERQVQMKGA